MAQRPDATRAFALAGVLAPVLFAAVVTFLTVLEYEFITELGWNPVRRSAVGWPSILALGELGWLQVATFALCGLLGVAFAIGLYRSARCNTWLTIGCWLLGVFAVAVALEAFETDRPSSLAPATWHGEIHGVAYPVVVVSAVAAPFILALALWGQPGWRRCGRYSLITAVILLAVVVLQAWTGYAQLFEYFFFGFLLLWLELLALRLWSIAD